MFSYLKMLEYPIRIKNPNPRLATIVATQYGGPNGELGASLRYLFTEIYYAGRCHKRFVDRYRYVVPEMLPHKSDLFQCGIQYHTPLVCGSKFK